MARNAAVDFTPSFVFRIEDLQGLLAPRHGPCVSIYFPSHRRKTEARSDSILYRNLCREVEKILQQDAEPTVARGIVANLRGVDDPEFWERGSDGVAVLAADGFLRCFRLPVTFPQLEVVGGTFHTKPLIRYLQSGTSYFVLGVGLSHVSLWDGWGSNLLEVPLNGIPRRVEDVVEVDREVTRARGADRTPHAQENGESTADVEKFFREVGRGLARHLVKDARKPLILAAAAQHQHVFRKVAQLPGMLDDGLHVDARALSRDAIVEQASEVLRSEVTRRVEKAREDFHHARSKELGSDRLDEVARAVAQGRVRQLCVQSGRRFWGLLDRVSGEILPGESHKNAYDVDLYDELAELVMGKGGEVLILTGEQMPSKSGVAAVYRY